MRKADAKAERKGEIPFSEKGERSTAHIQRGAEGEDRRGHPGGAR